MAVNLTTLRTELLTDPVSLGYASFVATGNCNGIIAILANISANSGGAGASTVTVGTVGALSLQQCVVVGEYSNLTNTQRDLWNAIITTATNGISISNTVIRQQIAGIWSATTTTRNNLAALQTRPCNRLEVLFGEGATIDSSEVGKAITGDF